MTTDALHIGLDVRTIQAGFAGDRIYLEQLIAALAARPDVAEVSLYGDERFGSDNPVPHCEKCTQRLFTTRRGWLWTPVGLPPRLRRDGVDVFHAPYLVPPVAPCPTVVTIHDLAFRLLPEHYPQSRARLRSALISLSAHRAGAVITDSEWSRRDLLRLLHLPARKVHVVPLAPAAHFTPGDAEEAGRLVAERFGVARPYILAVGYSSPRKNLVRLLEGVAASANPTLAETALVIVGPPGAGGPEAVAARFPTLTNRLTFTGWIPAEDLIALYRAAAVFAFPSLYEGFGLPVLEAMACGTPVVTSNASSLPEVAGDAAIQIDPNDAPALASAVASVLQHNDLAQELRTRGLHQAARFSWQRTAELTCEVYRGLLR